MFNWQLPIITWVVLTKRSVTLNKQRVQWTGTRHSSQKRESSASWCRNYLQQTGWFSSWHGWTTTSTGLLRQGFAHSFTRVFSPLRFCLALTLVVSTFFLEECSTSSRNRTLRVHRKSREPLNSFFWCHAYLDHAYFVLNVVVHFENELSQAFNKF